MYFWNIAKVREQLASGALNERTGFKYFMAHVVLYALSYVVFSEPDQFDYLFGFISIPILIAGVLFAHHCNGGYEGESFYSRLFAISWVMTIKFFTALVIFFSVMGLLEGTATEVDSSIYLYTELTTFTTLYIIYYWRIGVHMQRTNALVAAKSNTSA